MDNFSQLKLFNQYTRKEVHDIFDPLSPFSVGAGTWGIHGIVKIPDKKQDYVFFVTFGQNKLGHTFEEEITKDGILTWQSQPRQKLNDKLIETLINHNHFDDNIYLFLRTQKINKTTNKPEPFTYMGKVAYKTHDAEREAPVYFKWQLLNFEMISKKDLIQMNLKLAMQDGKQNEDDIFSRYSEEEQDEGTLYETKIPPNQFGRKGSLTREFKQRLNYLEINEVNSEVGMEGELLALNYLKNYLRKNGRSDLAAKTIHVSYEIGDWMGYDIESYDLNGEIKYIEVKTTCNEKEYPFYLTANELEFANNHVGSYKLFRIFNYDRKNNKGHFYTFDKKIDSKFNVKPISYRATL